jgi:glycosyltransferase involved in cell wall biosynthesis
MKKKIVFISTNKIFGGSEKLWLETVLRNYNQFEITVFVEYEHEIIKKLESKVKVIYLNKSISILKKIHNRLFNKTVDFKLLILSIQPDLIVFSNGEPFTYLSEFELINKIDIKYLIVNQLIADFHWLSINTSNYSRYLEIYKNSQANYFVSNENIFRFKQMLGDLNNLFIVNNPITFEVEEVIEYPPINEIFEIAFVGRFEFYHKGIDLLLNALKDKIWNKRNVIFNFYGEGPHKSILQKEITENNLTFCKIHDFTEDVTNIWLNNHIMVLTSRFEGKSLSISEASYYGRASIVTNVGGASEQIIDGKTGFLINQISSDCILSTLNKAWEARFDWKDMGLKARETYLSSIIKNPVKEFTEKIILYSNQ